MAGGDRTKWQIFLDMPLVEFLNAVSFHNEKQRTKAERLQQAAQAAKSAKDNNVYLIALLQEMV
jgi:gentisate 1,2-dioxygenase